MRLISAVSGFKSLHRHQLQKAMRYRAAPSMGAALPFQFFV